MSKEDDDLKNGRLLLDLAEYAKPPFPLYKIIAAIVIVIVVVIAVWTAY